MITGLRFEEGMGVEFLDFKQPTDGRALPKNAQANELIHWHTLISVDDVVTLFDE